MTPTSTNSWLVFSISFKYIQNGAYKDTHGVVDSLKPRGYDGHTHHIKVFSLYLIKDLLIASFYPIMVMLQSVYFIINQIPYTCYLKMH